MNLHFNYGEFFLENESSLITGLLIAVFASFFGLMISLHSIRVQNRIRDIHDLKLINKKHIDILKFLQLSIHNSADLILEQVTNYSKLAVDIIKTPYIRTLPSQAPFHTLEQLQNLENPELLASVTSTFKDDKLILESYVKLFDNIKLAYGILLEAKEQNERHGNFHHQDEVKIISLVSFIYMEIGVSLAIKPQTDKDYQFFEDMFSLYKKVIVKRTANNHPDYKSLKEDFFDILHSNTLTEIIDVNQKSKIFKAVKEALDTLKKIKLNSLAFADDMKLIEKRVENSISILKSWESKLEIGIKANEKLIIT